MKWIDDKQNRVGPDHGKVANEQKKGQRPSQLPANIRKFSVESDHYQLFCPGNMVNFPWVFWPVPVCNNVKFLLSVDGDISKKNLSKKDNGDVKKS